MDHKITTYIGQPAEYSPVLQGMVNLYPAEIQPNLALQTHQFCSYDSLLATLVAMDRRKGKARQSPPAPFEEQFPATAYPPACSGQNLEGTGLQTAGYIEGEPSEFLAHNTWTSVLQQNPQQLQYGYSMPYLSGGYMSSQINPPPPALQLRSSPLNDPNNLLLESLDRQGSSVFSDPIQQDYMESRKRGHTEFTYDNRGDIPQSGYARQPQPASSYTTSSANMAQEPVQSTPSTYPQPKTRKKLHPCAHCQLVLGTKAALLKHIASSHTRPFDCTLSAYGCLASFGSKNEWKRHIATKHINTGFWRCTLPGCQPVRLGDKYKDFNRKDLFMQHARRCHMPKTASSSSASPAHSKEQITAILSDSASTCYNHVRDPPPTSSCGFCIAAGNTATSIFSGPRSWDARLEHVAQHLERLEDRTGACAEDTYLRDWLVRENILVPSGADGHFVLRDLLTEAGEMEE